MPTRIRVLLAKLGAHWLGLGSLLGSRWVVRWRRPDLVFLWGQWGISASAGAALVLLCVAPPESLWSYWAAQTGIEIHDLVAALRAPGLSDPPSMRKVYRLGDATPDRMTDARAAAVSKVSMWLREYPQSRGPGRKPEPRRHCRPYPCPVSRRASKRHPRDDSA